MVVLLNLANPLYHVPYLKPSKDGRPCPVSILPHSSIFPSTFRPKYPRGHSSFSQSKRFTQQANHHRASVLSPIIHPRPTRWPTRKSSRGRPKPSLSTRTRTSRTRPHSLRRWEVWRWEASKFRRHVTWRHERRHATGRRTARSTLHVWRWKWERHAAAAWHVWSYLVSAVRLLCD